MEYFLSKEILEVHTQLILVRKRLHQVVHAKTGLHITYHANIFFLCSFQNVVGDGTPYLQVSWKALSSAVTTQPLEKSQMLPAATDDFEAPTDDDLELQNITEELPTKVINLCGYVLFYYLLLCLIIPSCNYIIYVCRNHL